MNGLEPGSLTNGFSSSVSVTSCLNGLDSWLIFGVAVTVFAAGLGKNLEVPSDLCGSFSPELSKSFESNEPESSPRKDNEPKSELPNEDSDSESDDSPNVDMGPELVGMLNILVGSTGFLWIRIESSCGSAVEKAIDPNADVDMGDSTSGSGVFNGANGPEAAGEANGEALEAAEDAKGEAAELAVDANGDAAAGFSGSVVAEATGLKGL